MQIGEVAARTDLSLRTIRHYEDADLVVPSARSQGGFRLYTEADVARLMVIRRMKPLGFSLDEMGELLSATDRLDQLDRLDRLDRLDSGEELSAEEHAELLECVRRFEIAASGQVAKLRTQLARAEEFAASLAARLTEAPAPAPAPAPQQPSPPVPPATVTKG
ncbi:MerR family transcriptional regulator [Streptomyces sp. NPDC048436]|uniref:MerR family transcriptional regulator n=1 Tax=Streptomyces sp. NPDC048436 TaxID=3365550 RepID=UPI003711F656